ncbi:MAG: discoidin domain-containing protein [Eubacterium sp.]|nr:discoidin domain-containing protein [Eubacterium sp.]
MIKKLLSVVLCFSIMISSVSIFGQKKVCAAIPLDDIAYGKKVLCSSVKDSYDARYAVDGNSSTKWVSEDKESQWFIVDLGAVYYVSTIQLNWGEEYPNKYTVSWSGNDWTFHDAIYWGGESGGRPGESTHYMYNRPIRYVKVQCNIRGTDKGISLYDFKVHGSLAPGQKQPSLSVIGKTNLALGKTVTASSKGMYGPEYLVDGNFNTKWTSAITEEAWIMVDLEDIYSVDGILIHWGDAYAKSYEIQYSKDGKNWSTVAYYTESTQNIRIHDMKDRELRYIKILAKERSGQYGYNMNEIEVLGNE